MKVTFDLTKNTRRVEVAHVGNGELALYLYESGKAPGDLSPLCSSEDCHVTYSLILSKSEARAIASAMMGCAAEV